MFILFQALKAAAKFNSFPQEKRFVNTKRRLNEQINYLYLWLLLSLNGRENTSSSLSPLEYMKVGKYFVLRKLYKEFKCLEYI